MSKATPFGGFLPTLRVRPVINTAVTAVKCTLTLTAYFRRETRVSVVHCSFDSGLAGFRELRIIRLQTYITMLTAVLGIPIIGSGGLKSGIATCKVHRYSYSSSTRMIHAHDTRITAAARTAYQVGNKSV